MISQDSSDPTGVHAPPRHHNDSNPAGRARNRKANAALALSIGGMGWDDIAASIGYPTGRTARVAAEKALERNLSSDEDRAKMRRMAAARLERLLRGVWPKAINPEHPEHLAAVGKARDVIGDHRKLFGYDAPQEIIIHNPDQAEIEAFVSRLLTPLPVQEFDIIEGKVISDESVPAE